MTEEELTQAAILKAQAVKREESADRDDIAALVKEASKQPIEKPSEMPDTPVNTEDYPFELVLGENKKVHFNLWTGKTKKTLKKLAAAEKEENFNEVLKVLLTDHIQEKDMFFSEVEQQYILLKIREESLTEVFSFDSFCTKCENPVRVTSVVEKAINYKPSSYPKDFGDYRIIDITSQKVFDKEVKAYFKEFKDDLTTETDIEIALHIAREQNSPAQTMNWMDDMSLKELRVVTQNLTAVASSMEVECTTKCPNCEEENTFKTSNLPNIFEDLME